MRIKLSHAKYIANKVSIDLVNSSYISVIGTIEQLKNASLEVIETDIKKELELEEFVHSKMEDNEDDIEFLRADPKELFWMIKKKMAKEFGVILNYEDRYNDVSHKIMDTLIDSSIINFTINENRVKNIIFDSIIDYVNSFSKIEELIYQRISGYKRRLIPGSDDYNIVFNKMYEEELKKRGML
jgi:hypothetical protein